MEIPPAEIIDRMSIVQLKVERIGNEESKIELEALKKEIENFKNKGLNIKDEWLEELYNINKKEWDLLGAMNEERRKGKDLAKIGELYLITEQVNKQRAEAKNKIVEATGIGFKEIKKNHPSA